MQERKKNATAMEVYDILHDFLWLLCIVALVFVFFVRVVGVDGSSMFPTLNDHDFLLLQSNFTNPSYRQGDIVVLTQNSFSDSKPLVKRVIAVGGQSIDIDFTSGQVFVDGVLLDEPYICEPTYLDFGGTEYPVTVPDGCVFVMGDNRNNSADSRYQPIGMIDLRSIMGKVLFLAFPGKGTDKEGNIVGERDFKRIGVVH